MKKLTLSLVLLFVVTLSFSQKNLPKVNVKSLDNKLTNTAKFTNGKNHYVLGFFATWCKPCLNEFNAISENYEDWQDEANFKFIAVSIDDARSKAKLKTMVKGNDWPFEFYHDENADLKRTLNVNQIPHVLIVNSKNEIVWEKSSFNQGGEYVIYDKFVSLQNK